MEFRGSFALVVAIGLLSGCFRTQKIIERQSNPQPVETASVSCDVSSQWSRPESFNGFDGNATVTYAPNIHVSPTNGDVYVNATGGTAVSSDLMIRRSQDGGTTWQSLAVDRTAGASSFGNFVKELGGVLYYTGAKVVGATGYHWVVYRSLDRGSTWALVDDYQETAGTNAVANDVARDAAGNIYVVGSGTVGGRDTWTIRRSPSGALGTWTTIDAFQPSATSNSRAITLGVGTDGAIYAGGFSLDPTSAQIVRKSPNGNAGTWTTIDTFQVAAGRETSGMMFVSPAGTLFVVAAGTDATGAGHWIVRRSLNAGVTFTVAEDLLLPSSTNFFGPSNIAADPLGNIFITGSVPSGQGMMRMIRRSHNGGATWATIATDLPEPGADSIAADGRGNLYIAGSNAPGPGAAIRKYTVSYPQSLSQTCLGRSQTARLTSGRIYEYEPKYQLWSDGASKRRWIYLPEGQKIDNTDMASWKFPVGTQLWKEFSRDGKKVETRLLLKVRQGSGAFAWQYVTYRWRGDQSDADLFLPGEKNSVGTQHDIVATNRCTACHAGGSDFVLGIDALQMKDMGDFSLKSALIFALPTNTVYDIQGTPRTKAALGYLHANCAHCHSPTGAAAAVGLNFRHNLDASSMQSENAYVTTYNRVSPATGFVYISPQNRTASLVRNRMSIRSQTPILVPDSNPQMTVAQMPLSGTDEVDTNGGLLAIENWIMELQ